MVVKLAYVAQDRVGSVESVKCLISHAERTTKQTHVGTQEIETVFYHEQKMRAYVSATHVRSVTAGARGFFLGRRLDREKEHERSACSTRTTFPEALVVYANTRCVVEWRSGVRRFDSRSTHELGESVTLPGLDDRPSVQYFQ